MKTGFTLTEILVAITIIIVLGTVAIASYTQAIDNARQRVCASNETVLLKAVENHFLTTGVAPATLGELKPEQVHKAYVEVMQQRDWLTKWAYFVVEITSGNHAHAQQVDELRDLVDPAIMQVYGVPEQVFSCPADEDGGISYGISRTLRSYNTWAAVPANEPIIADSDVYTFDTPVSRHKTRLGTQQISLSITKAGEIVKSGNGATSTGSADPDSCEQDCANGAQTCQDSCEPNDQLCRQDCYYLYNACINGCH